MSDRVREILNKIAMQKQAAGEVPLEATAEAPVPQTAPELATAVAQQGPQNVVQSAAPTGEEAAPGAGVPGDTNQEGGLLPMLIAAYNAEVCAAWQYEWARISALGPARNYFESECTEHRDEEWEHAEKLAELIDMYGGTVPFTLSQIEAQNPTPAAPEQEGNRDTAILVQQIIAAEQAAVDLYTKIEAATREGDGSAAVVNDVVIGFLATEQKHVVDMTKIAITIGQE